MLNNFISRILYQKSQNLQFVVWDEDFVFCSDEPSFELLGSGGREGIIWLILGSFVGVFWVGGTTYANTLIFRLIYKTNQLFCNNLPKGGST